MRAVVGGSHILDPSSVAMHLLRELAGMPIDTSVLLRGPLQGHPGPIEAVAEGLCRSLSIPFAYRLPQPGAGREGVIQRDWDMVDEADYVLAYFHPDRIMQGGTARIVERAIHTGKRVQAFISQDEGGPVEIGSLETIV